MLFIPQPDFRGTDTTLHSTHQSKLSWLSSHKHPPQTAKPLNSLMILLSKAAPRILLEEHIIKGVGALISGPTFLLLSASES